MVCARIRLLRRTHYPQNKGWAFCKTHRPPSIWTLSFISYIPGELKRGISLNMRCPSQRLPVTHCFLCSKDHATGRLLFILQDSGKCLLLSEPSQVLSCRRVCAHKVVTTYSCLLARFPPWRCWHRATLNAMTK